MASEIEHQGWLSARSSSGLRTSRNGAVWIIPVLGKRGRPLPHLRPSDGIDRPHTAFDIAVEPIKESRYEKPPE